MTEMKLQTIGYENLAQIRDLYLPLTVSTDEKGQETHDWQFDRAYAFTGDPEAKLIFDGADRRIVKWLLDVWNKSEAGRQKAKNFRIEHEGVMFRAHRAKTVEGPELALRALPSATPTLSELRMPPYWSHLLLDQQLLYGGLVLIAASTGQGKTTTMSATVKSRLEAYKGYAVTVEDPPELPLHGWHGQGRCNQLPVESTSPVPGSGFVDALVDARRYFPAITGGGTMLMIGEIRNNETAAETLLAANEGHLVLATFHGSSLPNALMRIASMAAEKMGEAQARDLLASTLKLAIYQNLVLHDKGTGWDRGDLKGEVLSIPSPEHQAAKEIREMNIGQIIARVEEQRRKLVAITEPTLQKIKTALRGAMG